MLNVFCDEHNILLTNDYSTQFINRNSIIEGMCKNIDCENVFSKSLNHNIDALKSNQLGRINQKTMFLKRKKPRKI
jgi:hypothetical protein